MSGVTKRRRRRSPAPAAAALAVLLLAVPTGALATTKEELTEQQSSAKQAYEEAQQQLEDIQDEQTQAESQIDQLEGQAADIAAQITTVTAAVSDAQTLLAERRQAEADAAAAVEQKQAEYDASLAEAKQQMRAMQMLDGGGAISILSQASDLYELLSFADVLQQMSAKNNEILTRLTAEEAELEDVRQQAQAATQAAEDAEAALEAQQNQLSSKQSELQGALQQANSELSELEAAEQAQSVVAEAARKEYEEATAALNSWLSRQSNQYTTADLHLTSLNFGPALTSYSGVTNTFGASDPWGRRHLGTDYAAPNGTPIYAVADGVVSAAGAVKSYGNCVQISHGTADDGNRYDSLYAHMSSIAVSQGQTVTKGQVIGYVGNTGDVWGANGGYHLHLEMRVNNSRVNAQAYVPM